MPQHALGSPNTNTRAAGPGTHCVPRIPAGPREKRGAGTQMHHQAVLLPSFPTRVFLPLGSQKSLVTTFLGQDAASKDKESCQEQSWAES